MNIYQLIDFAHQHRTQINDNIRYQLIKDIKETDLIKITDYFVSNLEKKHQMPGDVILSLASIVDWYREKQFITEKQKAYLVNSLIDYWNNLNALAYNELLI